MFNSIKHFFASFVDDISASGEISPQQLHIATAAMLIEMMHMDNKVLDEERKIVSQVIRTSFSLSDQQTSDLMTLAENQLHEATDYFQFTSLINKGFDQEQKNRLIKCLWEVAFIDGHLDEYEDYMVRKVADLLHVPHSDVIKLRNRVKEKHENDSTVGC